MAQLVCPENTPPSCRSAATGSRGHQDAMALLYGGVLARPKKNTLFGTILLTLAVGGLCLCSAQEKAKSNTARVTVPFVGCKSDGQAGPVDAPTEAEMVVQIDPKMAQKLAYYKAATSSGVLAPRGWYCFGTYDAGGDSTFVTPDPIDTGHFFLGARRTLTGAAIDVDHLYGGTSGRSLVARVIARVFPGYKSFVDGVIEMFDFLAKEMVFGPYPSDKLIYRSDRLVEYRTPPRSEGLGTMSSRLQPNNRAIGGFAALLGELPFVDVLLVSVRLPPEMISLEGAIVEQLEHEAVAAERPSQPQ